MFVESFQNAVNPRPYQYLAPWHPSDPVAQQPTIRVVTCFLSYKDRVLVLQRARKDIQHQLWGIPGGKLEKDELPIPGLIREIYEETKLKFCETDFHLLSTALSKTPCDGQYGLYLYHAHLETKPLIQINSDEHYAYLWVRIMDFKKLNLLTAQGEAFDLVEDQLHFINQ